MKNPENCMPWRITRSVANCSARQEMLETVTREFPGRIEQEVSARESIRPRTVVLESDVRQVFDEVFPVDPNFHDIRRMPGWMPVHAGIRSRHRDVLFGDQWIFSPPPLVFPVLVDGRWFGFGIGSAPGKNLYVGWTLRPHEDGRLTFEVDYEEMSDVRGALLTLVVFTRPHDSAEAVIASYSGWLRDQGWASSPRREPAAWWRMPFSQSWGEQCNLVNRRGGAPFDGTLELTQFCTQSNEIRWYGRLEEQGVPLGVASTGDKWQLSRHRLVPDPAKFPDLRGYVDWHHRGGRHVVAWLGMWRPDAAPAEMCVCDPQGKRLGLDPESPSFQRQLQDDVFQLISSGGYDFDGFFLDFSAELPSASLHRSGRLWGIELLHEYVRLIHEASKAAKPDAMILSHCAHPYFSGVVDVLRLNDYAFKNPSVVRQMHYRASIARASSDWLINTDNWCMYDIGQWREALEAAPSVGIPATWFTEGVFGEGIRSYEAFTERDYARWRQIWTDYILGLGLPLPRRR